MKLAKIESLPVHIVGMTTSACGASMVLSALVEFAAETGPAGANLLYSEWL